MDIYDLTFGIANHMQVYPAPWHPRVEITELGGHATEGRATRKIVLGSHTGTHVDAPLHFFPASKPVDQLAVEHLIGGAVLLDLRNKATIDVHDLEEAMWPVTTTDRIVIRTGWSNHYGEKDYFVGHPYLTRDASEWIVDKHIKLVGTDTPSLDNPKNMLGSQYDSPVHRTLLGAGVALLEYLTNLHKVRKNFLLVAAPLKIIGSDGAPARVFALCE